MDHQAATPIPSAPMGDHHTCAARNRHLLVREQAENTKGPLAINMLIHIIYSTFLDIYIYIMKSVLPHTLLQIMVISQSFTYRVLHILDPFSV